MEPYFPSAIVFFCPAAASPQNSPAPGFCVCPRSPPDITFQAELLRNMRKYEQNPFIISYFYANIG